MRSLLTIAALATAPAPAGVGVIRVSGREARKILNSVFHSKDNPELNIRKLIFGQIVNPDQKITLDHALAVFFQGPNSFTGEDLFELQIHGSPVLAQQVLKVLFANGAVAAEPGEFTRRAFENGKIDLLQAEAVGDLIASSSEQALQLANQQLSGKFSHVLDELGDPLKNVLAEIEAHIDFPDEDIEPEKTTIITSKIQAGIEKINQILGTFDLGQVVKEGYKILLCGLPNAGKSSLLNSLLKRPRAIVTDISGTTRDLLEESLILDGYQFVFCDSAGIRESQDHVEKIGVELAIEKIAWANLALLVVDATKDLAEIEVVANLLRARGVEFWYVLNKSDCPSSHSLADFQEPVYQLSALTGEGVRDLESALINRVARIRHSAGDANFIITNERQRQAFQHARESLRQCLASSIAGAPLEIVSEELRQAINSLSEIVGVIDTEDILGRIFSKFCIGK